MDYLVYLLIRYFITIVQALPIGLSMKAVHGLAFLFTYIIPLRRKLVYENLRFAFPSLTEKQIQHTYHRMWIHLFTLVLEVALIDRKIHTNNWKKYLKLHNIDKYVEYNLSERAVAMVTAHFGNFEAAGFSLGLMGFPTYSIARTLDNPYLNQFVKSFRQSSGQYIVARSEAAELLPLVVDLKATIGFLSDQHAGDRGLWVKCLNRETSSPKGVAVLVQANQIPACVGCARRINGEPLHFDLFLFSYLDPLDDPEGKYNTRTITEWYNRVFEEMITSDPTQYWWIHRKWREKPTRHAR